MRLCVLHFREELFTTVGTPKHGHITLNVCNTFWKITRKEHEIMEEGHCRGGTGFFSGVFYRYW